MVDISHAPTANPQEFGGLPDPAVEGVHLIHRGSGPPLRITGRRIFHLTGRYNLHISLWQKRGPGILLTHADPIDGAAAQIVCKEKDLHSAIDTLEAYCAALSESGKPASAGDPGPLWQATLDLVQATCRKDEFLLLTGRAIAHWTDHDPTADQPR